jgi:glycosyltransferase involved in cell wall biosynthesis
MSVVERAAVDMFISVSQATAEGNGLHKTRHHVSRGMSATHHVSRGMSATPRQVVIPNFLPALPQPHPSSLIPHPSKELASYLAQLPQTPFLLFVGDLRPIKGIDVLLEAYAGLENAPPLVLIGKNWPDTPAGIRPDDERGTRLPANISVFYDWPNDAVRAAWERSLIGLAPSRWREPFGIVIIEAMAGGSPVIASHVGGIPEIVIDGETGFLIPPGDAAALRAALARLIHDPVLCRTMGAAARQRAVAFTADSVVGRIEAVYQEILQP